MRPVIVAATFLLSMALGACKTHDELKVDVVCQSVCPCFADPDEVDECVAECQVELSPNAISEACFSCVLEESDSCAALDESCEGLCNFL